MIFINRKLLVVILVATLAISSLYFVSRLSEERVTLALPAATGGDPPLFYVKTQAKKVAFTFDISWGTKTPDLVLPILQQSGIKATFFISGPWTRRHVDIAQRIIAGGHELASHGDKHVNLSQYNKEAITENITKARDDIKAATGMDTKYFRPPNGDYDDLVVATARELGYETVIWGLDSIDWKNPGVDFMVNRIMKRVFPGAIILFHASDSSKQTHEALPPIIEGLRKAGYEMVTLTELLKAGEPGRNDPR